jgi:mannose-6-phosphate isomerase-like protein (cupin superfamily)
MDPKFDAIASSPENEIFKVVFFPDRIYHAQYLNATRSSRYRYNVMEVRGYADIIVLKGEVYFDGLFYSNFIRIEYRAGRLVEEVREQSRMIGWDLLAWMRLTSADETKQAVAENVRIHFDPWINAFQTEIWETLEPPANNVHDLSVQEMMGRNGPITRVRALNPLLRDIKGIKRIEIAFRESETTPLSHHAIPPDQVVWDNNYSRTHQEPIQPNVPSSPANTVDDKNYRLDFQRGYHKHTSEVTPVRYVNAMMDGPDNPDYDASKQNNIIEMRWMLQRELGSSLIFFHEVTIPPGKVEGNHQHIGSEELYFITQGEGIAYMRVGDDPDIDDKFPTEPRHVFGIGFRDFKAIPVRPGSMIFTKSGGMHGIRNTSADPAGPALKFVAFLYHSV